MCRAFSVGSVVIALLFSGTFLATIPEASARSGCCSHHGGVCGCGCCDGSGLSAKCAPYYPECSGGSTYQYQYTPTPTYKPTAIKAPALDRCSTSGLLQTYLEKKASGENMEQLSTKSWWKKCPQANRTAVYNQVYTPPPSPTDSDFCASFGTTAIYNALSEKCECTFGTVLIGSKCVNPPYCGTTATYSSVTNQCECNYGYRKSGKSCVAVSCTPNSAYNPKTNTCECYTGFLVKDGKCVSSMLLCGYTGKYDVVSGKCTSCGFDQYLQNGNCIDKPSCGLGSFNETTKQCDCGYGFYKKDGNCVIQPSCFGGTFDPPTGGCTCNKDYYAKDGQCKYRKYCGEGGDFSTEDERCICKPGYSRYGDSCFRDLR